MEKYQVLEKTKGPICHTHFQQQTTYNLHQLPVDKSFKKKCSQKVSMKSMTVLNAKKILQTTAHMVSSSVDPNLYWNNTLLFPAKHRMIFENLMVNPFYNE